MTKKISSKRLASVKITEEQSAWLALESGDRADSIASVVRSLLQKEVEKAKRKGWILN